MFLATSLFAIKLVISRLTDKHFSKLVESFGKESCRKWISVKRGEWVKRVSEKLLKKESEKKGLELNTSVRLKIKNEKKTGIYGKKKQIYQYTKNLPTNEPNKQTHHWKTS